MKTAALPRLSPIEGSEDEYRPGWARPYGTGPMAPWYASGDEDDEDEDSDEDDDSEDDEDEDDDSEKEWKPPTKEEWEAQQAKLRKANAQAKKHRLAAKQVTSSASTDAEKAKEQAQQAAEARYKPIVVKTAARAALAEAGALKPERLIKLLDMDELEIDDDGDVVGLEDEILALKKDYPEFFESKAKRASRVQGTGKTRGSAKPEAKSSAELIAERFSRG